MSLCALESKQTFAILTRTAFKLAIHALRKDLKLTCEYELHILINKTVNTTKDHGENYMKVRPPLVRYLLCNRLFTRDNFLKMYVMISFFQGLNRESPENNSSPIDGMDFRSSLKPECHG